MEAKTEPVKKESIKEFENLLKKDLDSRQSLKEGNIVKAKIVEIKKKFVTCEVPGSKFEAFINTSELEEVIDKLKVDSWIEIYISRTESFRNELDASYSLAKTLKAWDSLTKAHKKSEIVKGIPKRIVKGGLAVLVKDFYCFLPFSQCSVTPLRKYDHLIGNKMDFLIEKLDVQRRNCVLSHRKILERGKNEMLDKVLENLKVNDVIEATARAYGGEWGCFFLYKPSADQQAEVFVHISDVSHMRVNKISEIIELGSKVKLKIIKIEDRKISGSIKALSPSPFKDFTKKYKIGKDYLVTVESTTNYGTFCSLEPGVLGLCHASQNSYLKQVDSKKLFSPTQKVKMKLIGYEEATNRVSLSYREAAGPNPWDALPPIGSKLVGKVVSRTDFAIFCEIKDSGIRAMIHKNDCEVSPNDKTLEKFKIGEEIQGKLLEVDKEKTKCRMGIKQLQPSVFDYLKKEGLKEKSILTVTVKEVLPKKGLKVFIGNNENFVATIKKSDLALNVQDQRENIYQPGNRLDTAILHLDFDRGKLQLSVKEKERIENQEAVQKFGKEGKSSGRSLKAIFESVVGSKKKKTKNKKDS